MLKNKKKKMPAYGAPLSGALLAAVSLFAPGMAVAQGADDPPVLFLDIGMGLSYENNLNRPNEVEATTRFGVGYFTSTYNQRLSFQTGVTARGSEGDLDFTDPFVTIAYARFNRDFEIGGDLTYRRSEIDGTTLGDDFDADDLEREDGTREDIDLGVRLVTGRASPFGTDTQLRYEESNFFDGATTADFQRMTASSTLRFTIDPRIELTLSGFWQEEDTDDAANTVDTTTRVTIGADLAIDRAWSASVSLGTARVETETIAGTTSEEGLEGSFILTRDLPNGGLVFSTDHVVTDGGWRNSVRVRRLIEMANGDVFDASVGQIFFEEGGSGHLASLDFTRTTRTGFMSVGFDYSSALDDADQLIQRTRLAASLRGDLTDNSGWSVDGSMARIDYDNPATDDAVRFDVGLAYLHGLSNDWNLAARVEHQVLYENGNLDDRTNVFSLSLERRFSVRP
jgi:hypothetical protein